MGSSTYFHDSVPITYASGAAQTSIRYWLAMPAIASSCWIGKPQT
ncbi:hypothetical protein N599_22325 [Saccharopolyspora erythraea D]|nr:hypothetical protein N599_22325 [Saccharopolyspora erythraea D]